MDKRSDHDLLSDFAANASEAAFAILVDRHIGLVYSAAFRQLNDAYLAEDVTQAVFVLLARKARTLSKNTILAGWLYRTARFISRDVLKTETRRRKREQDAVETATSSSVAAGKWQHAEPHLDDALSRLGEKDRAAVLLRYFEAKSLHAVGQALSCSEEAARKRIDRAVEKLRAHLKERNALIPFRPVEELLSTANNNNLPAGAAIRATTAALADSAAIGTNVLALVKGALQFMFLTKLKQILAVVAIAALPTILLLGNPRVDKGELPTAAQIITKHLVASGSESLGDHGRDKPVGTACMSCHRTGRSSNEPLVTQLYARGEWQNQRQGLHGTFELRMSGPERTLESINITGLGRFLRGCNERTAWSIAPDGSVTLLAQYEAEQFKRETDFLIWPGVVNAIVANVDVANFGQKRSYRILENGNGCAVANYFDMQSGFRIGSTWKPEGSKALQTTLFQEYQPFDTITFPKRIVRRKTGSEEIFTVTNLTIVDMPLKIFKPPRGL